MKLKTIRTGTITTDMRNVTIEQAEGLLMIAEYAGLEVTESSRFGTRVHVALRGRQQAWESFLACPAIHTVAFEID